MESFFRLADAVKLHDPQGTHDDLGCKVIPTITIRVFCLDSSFNGSAQDCHTTCRLLRGNEPGNESRIDSLCETLTMKITSEPVGNWFCQLCIPSIKGQLNGITTARD